MKQKNKPLGKKWVFKGDFSSFLLPFSRLRDSSSVFEILL